MSSNRREFMKNLLSISSLVVLGKIGLAIPKTVLAAWPAKAFHSKNLDSVIGNLFGQTEISKSKKIRLKIPNVAQDGAVVPVTIRSTIDNVNSIAIFVKKNPIPLIANFEIFQGAQAFVKTRIKMADTSYVTVIVQADNKLYTARKKVKVAVGGC